MFSPDDTEDKKAALAEIRKALSGGHLAKLKPPAAVSVTVAKPGHDEPTGDEAEEAAGPEGDGDGPDLAKMVKPEADEPDGDERSSGLSPEALAAVEKALSRYMPKG
jgi:hypothetical protein